ncbi:hypothetical protein SNE40_015809 [Patella caerulea]|uniref:CARD domain-containing protein n=1 Tax=Patella caerulea TaxID=87958 RepID=A0AAN8JLF4_PATCE
MAFSRTRMVGQEAEIINRNFYYIQNNVIASDLTGYLLSTFVFNLDDKNKIDGVLEKKGQMDMFLQILLFRGKRAFGCFIKALKEKSYLEVANKLQDELKRPLQSKKRSIQSKKGQVQSNNTPRRELSPSTEERNAMLSEMTKEMTLLKEDNQKLLEENSKNQATIAEKNTEIAYLKSQSDLGILVQQLGNVKNQLSDIATQNKREGESLGDVSARLGDVSARLGNVTIELNEIANQNERECQNLRDITSLLGKDRGRQNEMANQMENDHQLKSTICVVL